MSSPSLPFVRIKDRVATKNHIPLLEAQVLSPEGLYRGLGYSYPKFFKMDLLCKWAWLGAEALLKTETGYEYGQADKNKIAVVLATKHGSLAVDKRYLETLDTIPSPALFVYTLPNIMLGELCIRHGFKGEQLCLMQDAFDAGEMSFWVQDLFKHRGMEHCIFGWVDALNGATDVCLFWASKSNAASVLPAFMEEAYQSQLSA